MKRLILIAAAVLCLLGCKEKQLSEKDFVRIDGVDLIKPDGSKLFIKGTNLGNWLNPEGYMFNFNRTNSGHLIDGMLRELAGPDYAAEFWAKFKDNYITREDIKFIAECGANTIRLPFHYKLFTNEDYMGLNCDQEGFKRMDSVVEWCREFGLYLILDMHDCPGGQTGDNIDDSYGYPWLFESEVSQTLFCNIWKRIAEYYRNEPVILGYELANEPIAPYFGEKVQEFNDALEPLYKKAVAAIREVDTNHIILLGGSQWNGNFKPFTDWKFDDKIMYTCHRYGGEASIPAIQGFIDFRDKTGLPMYMGEIGHNTDEWQADFCRAMQESNIGYTFWPYKKMNDSCWMGVTPPEDWNVIREFSEGNRNGYGAIRRIRPDQNQAKAILEQYLENCKFENCVKQDGYINSLLLK